MNYVAGYVCFQFATCGGFKAHATKGLHFPFVNLFTCLVSIDVFFVQDTGNLLDMAACVSQSFFCSKIKGETHYLLHRSSSTSSSDADLLLPPTPIFFFLFSSLIYNPISLLRFCPFALSVHVCFLLLCLPHSVTH